MTKRLPNMLRLKKLVRPNPKNLLYFFSAIALMILLSSGVNIPGLADINTMAITPQSALTVYQVPPQLTDNRIDGWLEDHYVAINQSVPAKNKLFIFFAATTGLPTNYKLLVQQAANNGYHAIGLRYPNTNTVGDLCAESSEPDCFEKVRVEILLGVDRATQISITRPNSIQNRLVKLLLYLNSQHPNEGWLNYLNGNAPKWSSLVVAGHSQGGGEAALIAKKHQVARVVMFAAPVDYSNTLMGFAPWLSAPHATPTENYYGFVHVNDLYAEAVITVWGLLGMNIYGESVLVDGELPPYNQSHQLMTATTPTATGQNSYHSSVAVDGFTPILSNGTPVFKDVWQYLCF